jgi:SAM-dependent methyltransferase
VSRFAASGLSAASASGDLGNRPWYYSTCVFYEADFDGSGKVEMVWRLVRYPWTRAKHIAWALRHGGRPFKEFYAESVAATLANKQKHNSLGTNLKPGRREKALRTFNNLVARGISPKDTLVDYGCGTLRIGALLIEFLEADRYIGLDIDERILRAARTQLSPKLLTLKRPILEVISEESLDRAAAKRPQWVFSNGVLQHVPPDELRDYFGSLSRLIHAGATGILNAPLGPKTKRIAPKGWIHDFVQLQAVAAEFGMHLGKLGSKGTLMSLRPVA